MQNYLLFLDLKSLEIKIETEILKHLQAKINSTHSTTDKIHYE